MGEIEPQKFNHEMQLFKISVKVAIEHVIQKLVRDIKKTKISLEKSPENKKLVRKMDNKVEVMSYLKSVKPLNFMKDLIVWKPEEHTHPEKLTLSEKGLCKVYNHRNMDKDIRKLVEKFELEKNPGRLFRYGNKKDKLLKNPKKNKGFKKKTKDTSSDNTEDENDEDIKENSEKPKPYTQAIKINMLSEENVSSLQTDSRELIQSRNNYKIEEVVKPSTEKKIKKIKNKEKVEKNTKKKNILKSEKPAKNNKKMVPIEEPKVEGVKVVDSFFKTKEGSNYVAIAPKRSAVEIEKQNKEFEDLKNRKRKIKDVIEFKQETKQKDENLHPSWKAKKQQNGIPDIKGKKIKLEKESDDNLHPSWLAKQKQKGIKNFQGKKITFDYETNDKLQPSLIEKGEENSLHPSWLAKQKERRIQPFKGTKISFEDD